MATPRERLKTILAGKTPDCVPVCPDTSNMIPARRTGKPFWDVYLKQDPPLWKAYVDTVKHFGYDGGFECGYGMSPEPEGGKPSTRRELIVHIEKDGSFFTQVLDEATGEWSKTLVYYTADNPPGTGVLPETVGLPAVPSTWEEPQGVKKWPTGYELWKLYKQELGDAGISGFNIGTSTCMLRNPDEIYEYYDDPAKFRRRRDEALEFLDRRMEQIAALEIKPDILFCGGSGSLVWQTPEIFRELALPVLKKATEMAHDLGIPTHVHSCGPEKELVKMAAEETLLTVIDPLEIPPHGDCVLAELKPRYGQRLILKGNLQTTDVMLNGSPKDVVDASKRAIDDGGKGGRFILSTGDQCGRDTPDENLFAMIETARTYGSY